MAETQPKDLDAKIDVLVLTTDFGQKFYCRTVEELGTFLKNFKKLNPQGDVSVSHARMTETEFSHIPVTGEAAKYFS
jgi:hypothetical protein